MFLFSPLSIRLNWPIRTRQTGALHHVFTWDRSSRTKRKILVCRDEKSSRLSYESMILSYNSSLHIYQVDRPLHRPKSNPVYSFQWNYSSSASGPSLLVRPLQ